MKHLKPTAIMKDLKRNKFVILFILQSNFRYYLGNCLKVQVIASYVFITNAYENCI